MKIQTVILLGILLGINHYCAAQCSINSSTLLTDNIVCCGESAAIIANASGLNEEQIVWWALADTPLTSETALNTAADIWPSNEDGVYLFNNNCETPAGTYYLTPFIAQTPTTTTTFPELILYSPKAGCDPIIEICPTFLGSDWEMHPFIINFPDSTQINIALELLGADIPLTPALFLQGTSCLYLSQIFSGNPNGTWSLEITNTGVGDLTVNIPPFDVLVAADSCSLITENQVISYDATSTVIAAGTTNKIYINIPEPITTLDFPVIPNDCTDFGEPIEILVLDEINYRLALTTCVDVANSIYKITIVDLAGGSPPIIDGATYNFPEPVTYDPVINSYTFNATIENFPYIFTLTDEYSCSKSINLDSISCILNLTPVIASEIEFTINSNTDTLAFNIMDYVYEPNNDSLSFVATGTVTGGTLTHDVNGNITFIPDEDFDGPVTIVIYITDGLLTSSGTFTITSETIPTAINSLAEISSFNITQIAPIPASTFVHINFETTTQQQVQLTIYDMAGRLIKQQMVATTIGTNNVELNIGNYATGIYFIAITNGQEIATSKFVKT